MPMVDAGSTGACVGVPTRSSSVATWVEVRQDGKLLFEYDAANGRVRLRRWGREFVVELARLEKGTGE